jgi:voltage-gated potassium channel
MRQDRETLSDRLNRVQDGLMTFLSLVMVATIVLQLVGDLEPPYDRWAEALSLAIWAVFAVEFLARLWRSTNRRGFLSANWLDVIILLLPVLRSLKVLRIVRLTRGYHGLRFTAWLVRGSGEFRELAEQSHLGYLLGLSAAVAVAAAFMVAWLEAGVPGAPLRTFGHALWWSSALITTINIGVDPVTVTGRIIAMLVRLYGVSVFVYLISALTAYWFGRPDRRPETPSGE